MAFVLACAARSRARPTECAQFHACPRLAIQGCSPAGVRTGPGLARQPQKTLRYRTEGEALITSNAAHLDRRFRGRTRRKSAPGISGAAFHSTTWAQVEQQLAIATDKIRPQVVNSDMQDAIDYEGNAAQGLSIIAIGGDKLSRGLTLEGLSVSYFLRASKMYDTLMQMGRWFGYRPGYVDLCRLYTTPDLELWFSHVSHAAEELRERLDHMAMIGSTPETYGLRIQSHDILLVTAPNKMRHAKQFQISFQGESKIQTVFFSDRAPNARNAATITAFLDTIGKPKDLGGSYKTAKSRRIWSGIAGIQIATLLGNLLFPDEARDVNASRLSALHSRAIICRRVD